MNARSLLTPILGLTVLACAERDPATLTAPRLAGPAAEQVIAGGVPLTLQVSLWRDFMPPAPPEGRALTGRLTVRTMDGSPLPQGLVMSSVSVFYQGQTWVASPFGDPSPDPSMMVRLIVGGPLWGPGVTVDVSVLLAVGHQRTVLSAKRQTIQAVF
jgi:hypothetical protein